MAFIRKIELKKEGEVVIGALYDEPTTTPPQAYILLHENGELLGQMKYCRSGDSIHILELKNFTHASFEGEGVASSKKVHGIGTALIDLAISHSPKVSVMADRTSHGFYATLGFIPKDGEEVAKYASPIARVRHLLGEAGFPIGVGYDKIDWESFEENTLFKEAFACAKTVLSSELEVEEASIDKKFFVDHWYWDDNHQPKILWKDLVLEYIAYDGDTYNMGKVDLILGAAGQAAAHDRAVKSIDMDAMVVHV